MEITILGSGGNFPTPMPTCDCRVCNEAREQGVPYARRGNSLYVHDERIIVDLPELIWCTLNREGIMNVDWVLLSHFHADHTFGLRALQAFGVEDIPITDFAGDDLPTLVMSEVTYERVLEAYDFFHELATEWADVMVVSPDETFSAGSLDVNHLTAPIESGGEPAISGFLLNDGDRNVLITPDENRHFEFGSLPPLDCWIKETGYFRETPDGRPIVTDEAERTLLHHEMSFEESLEQIRQVEADRVILTEIEELFRRSYDDYRALETAYRDHGIEFAYDGMSVTV